MTLTEVNNTGSITDNWLLRFPITTTSAAKNGTKKQVTKVAIIATQRRVQGNPAEPDFFAQREDTERPERQPEREEQPCHFQLLLWQSVNCSAINQYRNENSRDKPTTVAHKVNDHKLTPIASYKLSFSCPLAYITAGTFIHTLTPVVLRCKNNAFHYYCSEQLGP